jgi:hypothetical protein
MGWQEIDRLDEVSLLSAGAGPVLQRKHALNYHQTIASRSLADHAKG